MNVGVIEIHCFYVFNLSFLIHQIYDFLGHV